MRNLIAGAPSKAELEKMVNKYFYSSNYQITEDLRLYNKLRGAYLDGFVIRQVKGRWRFECAQREV